MNYDINAKQVELINLIDINNSPLPTLASVRSLHVKGSKNAVFSVEITRSSDSRYYNFETKTFEAAITTKSRLKNQKPRTIPISFPANASGDTYSIFIWPEPHFNTILWRGKNKLRYKTVLTQLSANATLTISTDTSISTVSATSMGTSSGSSSNTFGLGGPTIQIVEKQLTVPSSLSDYGVYITEEGIKSIPGGVEGEWDSNALYWETTAADHETTSASTHDSGSTSTSLVLNNVDDLYVGMHVSVIQSGSVTSTMPTIVDIDVDGLTVTLSAAQTWASGKDITFRAYGTELIKNAIGIILKLIDATVKLKQNKTTLRTAISSGQPTADVTTTAGISINAFPRCRFLNLASSTSVGKLSVVSSGEEGGTITVTNAEFGAATTGGVIYIDGSSNNIFLTGTIIIGRYPVANQTVYIDISKFLTAGAAS